MATVKGRADVKRYMAEAPEKLRKVLIGAGRVGGNVLADEVRDRSESDEVSKAVVVKVRAKDGRIVVRVTVNGRMPYYIALWLEYGTDPHFISVDDSQREGRSVARINATADPASLVIGGSFVGKTVFHPGARPFPAFRPALDLKGEDAIVAAQDYINTHITRGGVLVPSGSEGDA